MANEIINNIPQEVWDYLQCEAIIPYGNSNELLVGNSIYLNYGDTIRIGHTTLTFKAYKKQ